MELRKLNWDSEFFETSVYSIEVNTTVSKDEIRKAIGDDQDILLYVFLKDDNANLHDQLVLQGALFFDTRIIYSKNLTLDNLCRANTEIREYQGVLDVRLQELAIRAGEYSRFRTDSRLKPYFEGLYTAWIQNSLSGERADKVFVYEDKRGIVGLSTCCIEDSKGWTGLISVEASCQGKGVGRSLMSSNERYFMGKHVERSMVITQEDNLSACKFYESCGYEISQREFIYHWWI